VRQHRRHDTIRRPLQQIPDERPADAEAHDRELIDAQVVHQRQLVVSMRIPGTIGVDGSGRLTCVGVAEIRGNAPVFTLELPEAIERILQSGDRRVQSAAGDEQQWKSSPDLLVVDPNGPFSKKEPAPDDGCWETRSLPRQSRSPRRPFSVACV
jgi:hypothetical protein